MAVTELSDNFQKEAKNKKFPYGRILFFGSIVATIVLLSNTQVFVGGEHSDVINASSYGLSIR